MSTGRDSSTTCFICNLGKGEFDKNGLNFKKHQNKEHSIWKYVYFVVGLMGQNYTELDGTEQYVVNCLRDKNYRWIPNMQAHSISKKFEEEEDSDEEDQEEKDERDELIEDEFGSGDTSGEDEELDHALVQSIEKKNESIVEMIEEIKRKLDANEKRLAVIKGGSDEKMSRRIRLYRAEQKKLKSETGTNWTKSTRS
jgi:dipeptidyl aminopeptidase/acylaminoacyl peptidase